MLFLDHIWLIPLLPAFGAIVMFCFGRKLEKATVSTVCAGAIIVAFLFSCGAVWQYTNWASTPENLHRPYQKVLYTWLGTDTGHLTYGLEDGKSTAPFQADVGFLLDPLSSIWLLFVTGVGMLIHIYSMGYMAHEGGYYRFFGYLNLFLFSSQVGQRRRQQSIHRQPHRRRRISAWHVLHRMVFRLTALHRCHATGSQWTLRNRRPHHHRCNTVAFRWSLRKIGTAPALHLAA